VNTLRGDHIVAVGVVLCAWGLAGIVAGGIAAIICGLVIIGIEFIAEGIDD
jgi:hypothetical protein